MLAQSRKVSLRNGVELSTPLLIPSLSSGALEPMPFQSSPEERTPRLTPCSIVHSLSLLGSIEESLLVSAYDIKHKFLADSESFATGFKQSRYSQPSVLVIDSGWYEKNGSPPGSPFAVNVDKQRPWEEEHFRYTIDSLDEELKPVVVSWDYDGPYEEQIERAQEFFGNRSRIASVILLKPPKGSRFHNFDKLSTEHVANLRVFDIVGVTESEIGGSILERLVNIARFREHLNTAGVSAPIHVFGGLDPLLTPLYFASGAELFDGLGWLRYAYREGVAMHWTAAPIFERQITRRAFQAQLSVPLQNLDEINRLSEDLLRFLHGEGDWGVYSREEFLRPISESVQERLEARHGR